MEKGTSTWYLGTDHLGTIRVVTDAAGVVVGERTYDTWGRLVADTAPGFELPLGFADGLADPLTGLVRFGARDYDPATGTWTAPDPARFAGGVNLYGYAGADPVNRTDPTGRWCVGGSAYAGIGAGAEYCRGPDGSQSICMEVGVGIGAGIGISNGQPADTGWGVGLEASASCGPVGISGGLSVTRNECPDGRLGKRQAVAASKAGFGPVSAQVSTQDFENNTPGQLGLEQGGGSMDTRPGCGVAAKANLKRCVKF
jgi:RHS repeat-associated protein